MLMERPFARTLVRDPIRKDRKLLAYKRFQGHSDFRSPRQKENDKPADEKMGAKDAHPV